MVLGARERDVECLYNWEAAGSKDGAGPLWQRALIRASLAY